VSIAVRAGRVPAIHGFFAAASQNFSIEFAETDLSSVANFVRATFSHKGTHEGRRVGVCGYGRH